MTEQVFSEERLKELLKSAVVEALEDRRELMRDLIEEALEDFAMIHAIQEGMVTEMIEPH